MITIRKQGSISNERLVVSVSWQFMRTAFKHQEEGITFLVKQPFSILADEPGLGKTYQAIVALGRSSDDLNVIVCPASMKLNWEQEIGMVYPEDKVEVISGKWSEIGKDTAWIIVNYDILDKWVPHLRLVGFSLVGDEAHYIKGNSKRTKAFLELAKSAKRIHLLTGTPVMNRPIELYNLLKAIRHPLARTKTEFGKRYCDAQEMCMIQVLASGKRFVRHASQSWAFRNDKVHYEVRYYSDARGASNLGELKEKMSDVFLRRTKSEVLDLPPKIVTHIPFEMSEECAKRYDTAFDDYIAFLEANPVEGKNVDAVILAKHLVELQKLKQVCSESKIEAIVEAVEAANDSGEKVIVFSQYQATLDALRAHFRGSVGIDGKMSEKARHGAILAFEEGSAMVFVGNIKAAGVGINLTASSHVIFADLDWTPAVHEQAEDRAHRIGQTGTVNVRYYIAQNTIEEDIMEMLEQKRRVVGAVLSGSDEVEAQSGVRDVIKRLNPKT